jgi:two-component system nitrate/nitrite response regulator NarL
MPAEMSIRVQAGSGAMKPRDSFTVVLVGKSNLIREGLARILRAADFRIRASVSSADDLLQCKSQLRRPLFLIVHSGNDFDATVEQIEIFRDRHPDGRVAIVADHYRLDQLGSAFRAGANGYFVDVMTCDVFTRSLELVGMGGTIFPPAFLSFIIDTQDRHDDRPREMAARDEEEAIFVPTEDAIAPQLSPRERSILRCLIEGDSNKCIARKIDIAEATVKVHVKAILRKIRVQNRTQAAIWGMNNVSPARTANSDPPPLSSELNSLLPNPAPDIRKIKQVDEAVPLGVIDHETIRLDTPRADRLIRKPKTEGKVRLGN